MNIVGGHDDAIHELSNIALSEMLP